MADILTYTIGAICIIPFAALVVGHVVVIGAAVARGLGLLDDEHMKWLGEHM